MHLKIVKSTNEEKVIAADAATANSNANANDDNIPTTNKGGKGTQVLLELTKQWHHTGRLIAADT